jgi:ubiquinone/menaquinone biosynthesis C-methylase UbiE
MTLLLIDVTAFRDFEATGWEHKADPYDRFFGPITAHAAEPLLNAARIGRGTRVLDLACGPGYVAKRAADRGAAVLGIDIASAMIALARSRYPGIDFQRADAEELPFADGAFDAVTGSFILPHLSRPARAVSECSRVLAPAGTLALSMWDVPERNRLFGVLTDAVADAGAVAPADVPAGPPFLHYAADDSLVELLATAGFAHIEVHPIRFLHAVSGADALWAGLIGGTVRMAALVTGQTTETQARIRAAFDRHVVPYMVGSGLALPISMKVVSGRRPAQDSLRPRARA